MKGINFKFLEDKEMKKLVMAAALALVVAGGVYANNNEPKKKAPAKTESVQKLLPQRLAARMPQRLAAIKLKSAVRLRSKIVSTIKTRCSFSDYTSFFFLYTY